jgi:hypothetical protein
MGLHIVALNVVATPKGTIVGSAFVKSAMTASSLCSYRAMRLCAQCGFDWECDREAVLASLEGIGTAVRQRIESASSIRIRPSVDVWSALEYAAHTRDVARFYGRRIHAVLAEDRPQLHSVDFEALATGGRYHEELESEVLRALASETDEVVRQLRALTASGWLRVGIGSDGGQRTVLELSRRLAHDAVHHLLDIDEVLAAVRGTVS